MTVQNSGSRTENYICNGVVNTFPFAFRILDAAHLKVVRVSASGVEVPLVYPADYSVSGVDNLSGGSFTTALTYADGELYAYRAVPITQLVDLQNQGSFFAEEHERVFDKLTMIAQEFRRDIDGKADLVDGLVPPSQLPFAELRPVGTTADTVAAGDDPRFIFPTSPALTRMKALSDYGLSTVPGQEANNVTALRAAIADVIATGKREIYVDQWFKLDPDAINALANDAFWTSTPSDDNLQFNSAMVFNGASEKHIRIVGDDPFSNGFEMIGTGRARFFAVINRGNICFEDIGFKQNNSNPLSENYQPQFGIWYNPRNATKELSNFRTKGIVLDNNAGANGLLVSNFSNYVMRDYEIDVRLVKTRAGNLNLPNSIGGSSDAIALWGMLHNLGGEIRDGRIRVAKADAEYCKRVVAVWSGVKTLDVDLPEINSHGTNVGMASGGYAAMAYSNHYLPQYWTSAAALDRRFYPTDINFRFGKITNPRTAGLYLAAAGRITVEMRDASGQSDTDVASQACGMIAATGCDDLRVNFLRARDNVVDVHFINNDNAAASCIISDYVSRDCKAGGQPLRFTTSNANVRKGKIKVSGFDIVSGFANVTGVYADQGDTASFYSIEMRDGEIAATLRDVNFANSFSATQEVGDISLHNIRMTGTGTGIEANNMRGGRFRADNCVMDMSFRVAGAIGFRLLSNWNLALGRLHAVGGSGTQYVFDLFGSRGTIRVTPTYVGTTDANRINPTNEMGRTVPTWTGANNDFVANLATVAPLGSTPNRYWQLGWRSTSSIAPAWIPERGEEY